MTGSPLMRLIPLVAFWPGFSVASDLGWQTPDMCAIVDTHIPGRITYPGNSSYMQSVSSYYASEERDDAKPSCIFTPTNTAEVSKFVRLVKENTNRYSKPQFAVRCGGHMLFAGAANIHAGITVDMRAMNDFSLSPDNKMASMGGGSIWSDVYPKLDPHNVTVVGARCPGIGVGGFATGGGINFQARAAGWSADNIIGYEVVLASGQVVYATSDSYRDLWLALKGGSNNFGIVTRFDVGTIPQELMWGGVIGYNYSSATLDTQAKAFSDYMKPENFDPFADMGIILEYSAGEFAVKNSLFYLRPVPYPKVYQEFTSIPSLGPNSLEVSNVSQVVVRFGEVIPPNIDRVAEYTYSFTNGDASLYRELMQTWESYGKKLARTVEGLQLQFLIQPLPVTNGTNSMGLEPGRKDLVISELTAAYANSADDDYVSQATRELVYLHETLLASRGLYFPFKYLNYADPGQNPISTYGHQNIRRLQAASRKYDPEGMFQTTVPGGFKLPKSSEWV